MIEQTQVPEYFRKSPPENVGLGRFTEGGLVYLGKPGSIWGKQCSLTVVKVHEFFGSRKLPVICDIGGGDGRYTNVLNKIADRVIAADADPSALWKNRKDHVLNRVEPVVGDIFTLPFKEKEVDAVFSAALFHLYDPITFKQIASEIERILKPRGRMLLEFSYDIKRVTTTGQPRTFGNERSLNREETIKQLKEAFPNFEIEIEEGDRVKRTFTQVEQPYKMICKNLLVTGIKRK